MSTEEIRERLELLEDARERAETDEHAADLVAEIESDLFLAGVNVGR